MTKAPPTVVLEAAAAFAAAVDEHVDALHPTARGWLAKRAAQLAQYHVELSTMIPPVVAVPNPPGRSSPECKREARGFVEAIDAALPGKLTHVLRQALVAEVAEAAEQATRDSGAWRMEETRA